MDHQFSGGVDKQPSKTSRTTKGGGGGGGGEEEGLVVGGLSAKEKQQLVAQYGVESDGEDDLYPSHTFSVQTTLPTWPTTVALGVTMYAPPHLYTHLNIPLHNLRTQPLSPLAQELIVPFLCVPTAKGKSIRRVCVFIVCVFIVYSVCLY